MLERQPSAMPSNPFQVPGVGPSAKTNSISGSAHSAELKSPRSQSTKIERTSSRFPDATDQPYPGSNRGSAVRALLGQAGGFECFGSRREPHDADDLLVTNRPDRCLVPLLDFDSGGPSAAARSHDRYDLLTAGID